MHEPAPSTASPAEVMFEDDHASRALGIELIDNGEGRATARMRINPAMVNGHGNAHGGYIFLLADTAFACACNDSHETATVAAGADITYLRPARLGDELVARAHERTTFGRSGIYDVSITRGTEVIAEFRGHSRTLRAEGATP